jgi:hypothetical protein
MYNVINLNIRFLTYFFDRTVGVAKVEAKDAASFDASDVDTLGMSVKPTSAVA